MAIQVSTNVGAQNVANGASPDFSVGNAGEQLVADYFPSLYNLTKDGKVFTASTAVAGVDHGATLSTAPPFCIYNPVGSGKNLVILAASMGYVSGTLGAGFIAYAGATVTAAPTGTTVVPVCTKGGVAAGSVATVLTSATLAVAPNLLRAAWNVSAELATTALAAFRVKDELNGEFIVPPGAVFVLNGVCGAAGTTPRVVFGVTWAEVPQY